MTGPGSDEAPDRTVGEETDIEVVTDPDTESTDR